MGNFPGTQEQLAQPLNNRTIKKPSDFFFSPGAQMQRAALQKTALGLGIVTGLLAVLFVTIVTYTAIRRKKK